MLFVKNKATCFTKDVFIQIKTSLQLSNTNNLSNLLKNKKDLLFKILILLYINKNKITQKSKIFFKTIPIYYYKNKKIFLQNRKNIFTNVLVLLLYLC